MISVDDHIKAHRLDVTKIDNYNRKNFVTRYNELLKIVAYSIVKAPDKKIHVNQIRKYIIGKLLLSEVASRRYMLSLEHSGAFKVEQSHYMLPDEIDVELKLDG